MIKVVCLGTQPGLGKLYCEIRITGGRLSITGVEGPEHGGDCLGSCGQVIMHEWGFSSYEKGWDAEMVEWFRRVWSLWHLNYMRAGTPKQEAFLRENKIGGDYAKAVEALKAADLYVDGGYKYGSAWLKEELPPHVVQWLKSLPDAESEPAWV